MENLLLLPVLIMLFLLFKAGYQAFKPLFK